MTKKIQHEAIEQQHLFQWAAFMSGKYPALEYLYHIPNGGSRNLKEAANLKKQGVRAGVPDLDLPVARKGYHGLRIELKFGKNDLSVNQKRWLEFLRDQGYATAVCYGWKEAVGVICRYLDIKESGV